MQPRPPPRWPPPARWAPPPPRLGFLPPLPPPVQGFPCLPRFYPQPPLPPRCFYPRFVRPPAPPRPPPPRPPAVDTEQQWLDTFKRMHCSSTEDAKSTGEGGAEPPLRALRRRVAKAQELVEQLKTAAVELAAVEQRLETLDGGSKQQHGDEDATVRVEAPRLRVQRERKLATCEALKKELEAMNATSGLFPEQQLQQIRAFAAKVKKKKAYRKRAKLRRRAEASIRRAVDANALQKVESTVSEKNPEVPEEKAILQPSHPEAIITEPNASTYLSSTGRDSPKQSLDPETLTIEALIAVRRAWDAYIVFPQTPGASTIPPHFVPPPPAPSAVWAAYVASSTESNAAR